MLHVDQSQNARAAQAESFQASSGGVGVATATLRTMKRRGPLTASDVERALSRLSASEITEQTASTMMTCLQGRPWHPRDFLAEAWILEAKATPALAQLARALHTRLRNPPVAAARMDSIVEAPVRPRSPIEGLIEAAPSRPATLRSHTTLQTVPEMQAWHMDLSTQQLIEAFKLSDEGFLRDRDMAKEVHKQFESSFKEANDDFAATMRSYLQSGVISQEEYDAQAGMLQAARSAR